MVDSLNKEEGETSILETHLPTRTTEEEILTLLWIEILTKLEDIKTLTSEEILLEGTSTSIKLDLEGILILLKEEEPSTRINREETSMLINSKEEETRIPLRISEEIQIWEIPEILILETRILGIATLVTQIRIQKEETLNPEEETRILTQMQIRQIKERICQIDSNEKTNSAPSGS